MNIGEFRNVNGRLMGSIATRTIDLPRVGLRPVESNHERAPAFEVVTLNVGNRWVQIGALWEATANASGEIFFQGSLDDPSLNEPLPIALFGTEEEGYRVAWRRREARHNFGATRRRLDRDDDGPGDERGGFGDSTVGNSTVGDRIAGDDGDDDRMPF